MGTGGASRTGRGKQQQSRRVSKEWARGEGPAVSRASAQVVDPTAGTRPHMARLGGQCVCSTTAGRAGSAAARPAHGCTQRRGSASFSCCSTTAGSAAARSAHGVHPAKGVGQLLLLQPRQLVVQLQGNGARLARLPELPALALQGVTNRRGRRRKGGGRSAGARPGGVSQRRREGRWVMHPRAGSGRALCRACHAALVTQR